MAEMPFKKDAENSIPTNFKATSLTKDPPKHNLYLRNVFGYRCYDCKDNIKFTSSKSSFIFFAGSVAVKMDTQTYRQDFFTEHVDDIVAIDISSD